MVMPKLLEKYLKPGTIVELEMDVIENQS